MGTALDDYRFTGTDDYIVKAKVKDLAIISLIRTCLNRMKVWVPHNSSFKIPKYEIWFNDINEVGDHGRQVPLVVINTKLRLEGITDRLLNINLISPFDNTFELRLCERSINISTTNRSDVKYICVINVNIDLR